VRPRHNREHFRLRRGAVTPRVAIAMMRSALAVAPAVRSRRAWLAAGLGLLVGVPACAQAPPPGADALAAEWRTLRGRRGHFDGAAFDADIDRWQGRKHVLMQQLAAHAYQQRSSREALLRLLGPPDAATRDGQAEHAQALREARWQGAPRGEMLVYDWRGRRDRLVFALHEDRVVAAGWIYTYEQ
jgi:hypothetical protein